MGKIFSTSLCRFVIALFIIVVIGFMSVSYYQKIREKKTRDELDHSAKAVTTSDTRSVVAAKPGAESDDIAGEELGPPLLEAATKALNDSSLMKRTMAALRLRKEPSAEAVKLLAEFLDDKENAVVVAAIDSLGIIGANNDDLRNLVFSILEKKAMDGRFNHRGQALVTAAIVGQDRVLRVVSDFISEETDISTVFAARALAVVASPACVPHLKTLLDKSRDPNLRRNCINTLAKVDNPETLELLEKYAFSSSGTDKAYSVGALARLNRPEINQKLADEIEEQGIEDKGLIRSIVRSPAAPEIIGKVLKGGSAEKEQSISLLRSIADYSSTAKREVRSGLTDSIVPLLDSKDPEVEIAAIEAIASLGKEDVVPVLEEKLESDDASVRQKTLIALAPYANPQSYKIYLDLIWDDDQYTRNVAFALTSHFVDSSDVDTLKKVKEDHPDKYIRKQARILLKNRFDIKESETL